MPGAVVHGPEPSGRVLVVTGTTVPSNAAHSIQAFRTAAGLIEAGAEAFIVAPRGDSSTTTGSLQEFYGLPVSVPVEQIAGGAIPFVGSRTIFYLRVLRSAKETQTAALFTRVPWLACAAACAGIPAVVELHSVRQLRGLNAGAVGRCARRRQLTVVAISRNLAAAALERLAIPPDLVLVARDAVFVPTLSDCGGRRARAYNIGYAGSPGPGRGAQLLLEIARMRPDWHVHVLTHDPVGFRTDLCGELPPNICISGPSPPGEVSDFLSRMDVLVAPYSANIATRGGDRTAQWMSPLKLFEYMATCRPIVASDLPAIREVLDDGETASLCDPGDVSAWVAAIDRILTDAAYAKRIAERAYAKARREHTWQVRGERILRAISEVQRIRVG